MEARIYNSTTRWLILLAMTIVCVLLVLALKLAFSFVRHSLVC